eukprot:3861086-Pyramimonas_sp.AAC.1
MQRCRSKRRVSHTSALGPAGKAGDCTAWTSKAMCPTHAAGEDKSVEYHPGLNATVIIAAMEMHATRGQLTSPSRAAPQTPARTRCRGAPCTAAPKAKNFTGAA